MSDSYTPGPWFGKENEGVFADKEGNDPVFETGCGCCTSGSLSGADARLISAAPDLLEALQLLVDEYVTLVEIGVCGICDEDDWPELEKARAAIAKALGKTEES